MSTTISLKELERKAWRSVFQDGLWDIYLGLLLLALAIGALLPDIGVPASRFWWYVIYLALMLLAMLALWAGKRFITIPRMGRVKFGPKGKARRKKARLILALSVVVGLVLFVFTWLGVKGGLSELPLVIIVPTVWAVNMLTVFSLGAYFLEFERLYLIGVLYAIPMPADILLDELAGIKLGFYVFGFPAAAIILIVGLVVFVRFLRDYPVLASEASSRETFDASR